MSADNERFASRWSRLKQEQAKEQAAPSAKEAKGGAGGASGAEAPPAPVLPRVEDLKADSDFKPFMDPRVDLATRCSALKKLFTDAHFKVPDAFEPYSIDLTGEDPIPAEMLKTLKHARRLLFDEKEQVEEQVKEQIREQAKETMEKPLAEAKDVAGKQDA
jgi:hypothetical protein